MRNYPRNSPEAAARIVALVLIADGHVCQSEIDTLNRLGITQALGLPQDGFARIVHTLCEDLMAAAYASGSMLAGIDDATLASLMAEVDDPALQQVVLHLALSAAQADKHLAEAEAHIVGAAGKHWGIDPQARPERAAAPAAVVA